MSNRIMAFASLAGHTVAITRSMGEVLISASGRRERSAYYEDHF